MKKRILATTLAALLCAAPISPAFAVAPQAITPATTPVVTTAAPAPAPTPEAPQTFTLTATADHQYPLKALADQLGIKLTYDGKTQVVGIPHPNGPITLNLKTLNTASNAVLNPTKYKIKVVKGVTHVSKEFIEQVLGLKFNPGPAKNQFTLTKYLPSLESQTISSANVPLKNKLGQYFSQLEVQKQFSGQVLIAKGNEILIHRAYGYADREAGIKNTVRDTFSIGSITKQMTAASIIQLANKKQLAYDSPLLPYMPTAPYADKITVHQLLTHTGGLYNFNEAFLMQPSLDLKTITTDFLMNYVKSQPLQFTPGTKKEYSNTGYYLLGALVETLSKQPLDAYLQENLFKVADMKNTSVAYSQGKKLVTANGYTADDANKVFVKDVLDPALMTVAGGAGYLASTTEDLYKWNNALYQGKIVPLADVALMNGQDPTLKPKLIWDYGYGIGFGTSPSGLELSHNGNTAGFTAFNGVFPEQQLQVIILSNRGVDKFDPLKADIHSIIAGKPGITAFAPPANPAGGSGGNTTTANTTAVVVPEATLQTYVGTYSLPGMGNVVIISKNGALIAQMSGALNFPLEALSNTIFKSRSLDATIEFTPTAAPMTFTFKKDATVLTGTKQVK